MATIHQIKPTATTRRAAVSAHPIPDNFQVTPELRKWAADRGITRLDDRLEHFIDLARAKGYLYLDWSAAFRNACRTDWAKLGMPIQPTRCARCRNIITAYIVRQDGKVCDPCDRQGRL